MVTIPEPKNGDILLDCPDIEAKILILQRMRLTLFEALVTIMSGPSVSISQLQVVNIQQGYEILLALDFRATADSAKARANMFGKPLGQGVFQADRSRQRKTADSLNFNTTSRKKRQLLEIPFVLAFWSRRAYSHAGVEGYIIFQADTEASMVEDYTREPNTITLHLCYLPQLQLSRTGVITTFSQRCFLAEPRIPPKLTSCIVVQSKSSRILVENKYERYHVSTGSRGLRVGTSKFCVTITTRFNKDFFSRHDG